MSNSLLKGGEAMARNNKNDKGHFMISYELLRLIRWIIEHDQEGLKRLIERAFDAGLAQEITELQHCGETHSVDELQGHVVEFFALLEALLSETAQEESAQEALERSRIPAIRQVDTHECDSVIMAASIAKAAAALDADGYQNGKEIFCRELLKRWKPAKRLQGH
jgi:hypothetical protein